MHVNGTCIDVLVGSPDLAQQRFARPDLSGMRCQQRQQVELPWPQVERTVMKTDGAPHLVDLQHVRGSLVGKQIGRASCRERVEISVVAVSLRQRKTKISNWIRD